jgi:hypothetical protein
LVAQADACASTEHLPRNINTVILTASWRQYNRREMINSQTAQLPVLLLATTRLGELFEMYSYVQHITEHANA